MNIKKITHALTFLVLFLLPFFSLIVANSLFFPFITGKAIFFRFVVEVAFCGWVILAFIDQKYRPKITPLSVGVTIFMLVALVADLLGVNPLRSIWSNFERMEGWITIIHLWALFITMTSMFGTFESGKKIWHRWFNVSLLVALISGIYGIVQLLGYADIHQGGTRLDASLGNSAYFAIYMLIHAFLAVYMFIYSSSSKAKSTLIRWYYAVLSVLFAFLVFETQTRGTILGLIGGVMLALFLYALLAKKDKSIYRYISVAILIGIVLLGVVFWMNRKAPIIQNSALFGRLASISWTEAKGQARNYIWPMAVKGALERPLFGWGQENFNYIFNANYEPAMYAQEQWFDRAHSVFLDWLVAGGIIGLLAYLALYVLLLANIWKSSLTVAEKSVLTGLVAGYFIHNIFVFDNIASYVMFFAILGFADSQLAGKHRVLFGNRVFQKDTIEYVVLPVVIVLFVLTLYSVQYRVIKANTRLITALISCSQNGMPDPALYQKALAVDSTTANQEIREQILNCALRVINAPQAPGPMKQSFFALAMQEIQNQISYAPKDARIYVLGGSFMNGIGQYGEAVPLLEKALELSPRKQSIIYDLATSYINLNKNIDKAVEIMKGAYESAKDNSQAKISYATTLISADKEKEAKELYKDNPTALITPQVAQVYFIKKQYTKAIEIYKALVKANPKDVNYRAQLAQTQFVAGFKYDAIETLRTISRDNPELKDQVEQAIKQIEKK